MAKPKPKTRARKRPKKYAENDHDFVRLRARWRRWLPTMSSDLSELFRKREIFWELQTVAKENNKVLNPGAFFGWMCNNYVVAVAIQLRAFVDTSKSHSLWQMLFQILEQPGVIDIEYHSKMYRNSPGGIEFGRLCFRNCVGERANVLSTRAIKHDLRTLEDASDKLRRFVNKRIAHRNPKGAIRRLPTFNEIDSTMDAIDKMFCKDQFLLTASGMESCRATAQYDWRAVLWHAWVPEPET
jgi:hypothetical protein